MLLLLLLLLLLLESLSFPMDLLEVDEEEEEEVVLVAVEANSDIVVRRLVADCVELSATNKTEDMATREIRTNAQRRRPVPCIKRDSPEEPPLLPPLPLRKLLSLPPKSSDESSEATPLTGTKRLLLLLLPMLDTLSSSPADVVSDNALDAREEDEEEDGALSMLP